MKGMVYVDNHKESDLTRFGYAKYILYSIRDLSHGWSSIRIDKRHAIQFYNKYSLFNVYYSYPRMLLMLLDKYGAINVNSYEVKTKYLIKGKIWRPKKS